MTTTEPDPQIQDALDALWGMFTPKMIRQLRRRQPEVITICRANHEHINQQKSRPSPAPADHELTLQQLIDRHGGEYLSINHEDGQVFAIAVIDNYGDELAVYDGPDLEPLTEVLGEARLHIALTGTDEQAVAWPT